MRSAAKLTQFALAGEAGRFWYQEAEVLLDTLAQGLEVPTSRLCDVLAIMSPRVAVRRSVVLAIRYLVAGDTTEVLAPTRAALAHYENTGQIRGVKTSAFSLALQGVPDAIVLDTWVARALDVPETKVTQVAVAREARKRIHQVANRLGWEPREVQAALWTYALRHLATKSGQPITRNAPSFADILRKEVR